MFNKEYFDLINNDGMRDLKYVLIDVAAPTPLGGHIIDIQDAYVKIRHPASQLEIEVPYDQILDAFRTPEP